MFSPGRLLEMPAGKVPEIVGSPMQVVNSVFSRIKEKSFFEMNAMRKILLTASSNVHAIGKSIRVRLESSQFPDHIEVPLVVEQARWTGLGIALSTLADTADNKKTLVAGLEKLRASFAIGAVSTKKK